MELQSGHEIGLYPDIFQFRSADRKTRGANAIPFHKQVTNRDLRKDRKMQDNVKSVLISVAVFVIIYFTSLMIGVRSCGGSFWGTVIGTGC